MKYEIQRDRPIPATRKQLKYPWPDMNVGDCIEVTQEEASAAVNSLTAWLQRHREGEGLMAVRRALPNGNVGVWLTLRD